MFNSKIVFILGAGASHEAGFPLGSQLKQIISSKLDLTFNAIDKPTGAGDYRIADKLTSKFRKEINDYIQACWNIRDGIILSDSIDDFIDIHRHDERIAICGKLAIAFSIIEEERKSKFYFERHHVDDSIKFNSLGDVWYTKFYSLLTKQIRKESINNLFENITIINFNYDRSLEFFLINAISKNYIINTFEASRIVDTLLVYRPYGSIDKSVAYGSDRLPDFDNIVSNLKTYTEKVGQTEELDMVRQAIVDSKAIVFLGMAYHPNNMSLLRCDTDISNKTIYATRKSISVSGLDVVMNRIYCL
jgi:hypothetical protein